VSVMRKTPKPSEVGRPCLLLWGKCVQPEHRDRPCHPSEAEIELVVGAPSCGSERLNDIGAEMYRCAVSWEACARILGNVTAGDVAVYALRTLAAVEELDRLRARERELEAELREAKHKLHARALAHEGTLQDFESVAERAEKAEARVRELEEEVRHAIGAFDCGYPREVINRLRAALEKP
jgi:hypothetical protein